MYIKDDYTTLNYYENFVHLLALAFYIDVTGGSSPYVIEDVDECIEREAKFQQLINNNKIDEVYKEILGISRATQYINEYLAILKPSDCKDNIKPKKASEINNLFIKTTHFVKHFPYKCSLLKDSFKLSIQSYYIDYPIEKTSQFKALIQKPLIEINQAILLLNGYDLKDGLASNCVQNVEKFKDIYNMLMDSIELGEITLHSNNSIINEQYKLKPKEFLKWALEYEVIDTEFLNRISVNIEDYVPSEASNNTTNIKSKNDNTENSSKKHSNNNSTESTTSNTPYTTDFINLMHLAIKEFWQGYNPKKDNAPLKKTVVAFIEDKAKEQNIKVPSYIANTIDTIIRHPEEKGGGLKKS